MTHLADCPFCAYAAGTAEPPGGVQITDGVMEFTPTEPMVPGHHLVAPAAHVTDVTTANMWLSGQVMHTAALLAVDLMREGAIGANLATNVGASQAIGHLHVHVLPRYPNTDVTELPWRTLP